MRWVPRQKIWLAFVITLNAALWLIPSDVVDQIARDRQTLLGRYSRTHFTWNVAVGVLTLVSLYIDWSTGPRYKRRWFQVAAMSMVLLPGLMVMDFFLRTPESTHYVRDSLAYHRPPHGEFHATFQDKPEAFRTYPQAPPGYGAVECTLRTDSRGFRNQDEREQYDIVVLGDSFAEGSNVSDEHCWPSRLREISGRSVCNLGMSGYDPLHYLAALEEYGMRLKPRYVVCMFYEGNDFRSSKADRKRKKPSLSKQWSTYMDQSPILNAIDRFFIETFGPIGSRGTVQGVEVLDWMPLAVPSSVESGKNQYYAFAPKQLRGLYQDPEEFALDKHWLNPRAQILEMKQIGDRNGFTLVVVLAPTKAHVVLPLVKDRLSPDKVRAFTALDYDDPLPDAQTFLTNLLHWVDGKDRVMKQFCERESIPCLMLTDGLREAAINGEQVYYTYDQHWTPRGHEVVAEKVNEALRFPEFQ